MAAHQISDGQLFDARVLVEFTEQLVSGQLTSHVETQQLSEETVCCFCVTLNLN